MTSRERLDLAEIELRDAIASRDAPDLERRIPALVTALVTAALVAGVEAERARAESQKSESAPQISVAKSYSDLAN